MTYHWPTREGWLMIAALLVMAVIAGGATGLTIMLAFVVFLSVMGNALLP